MTLSGGVRAGLSDATMTIDDAVMTKLSIQKMPYGALQSNAPVMNALNIKEEPSRSGSVP